jgi:FkbM family methyltransferase
MNREKGSPGGWLKRAAWRAPPGLRHRLRKFYFGLQAARGTLASNEPEHAILHTLLPPGSWAIDVGANVGLYTLRMSQCVGPGGRVIAFEPVASTFEILAANCRIAKCCNVTLVNAAASNKSSVVSMAVPQIEDGSPNFYQAQIREGESEGESALAVSIDSLHLPGRVALAKVDAEGHDAFVLHGMAALLERDGPILIIESGHETLREWLAQFGYEGERLPGSSNVMYRARKS